MPGGLEFPIRVLPIFARRNGLQSVPMLSDFPILDPVEIVVRRGAIAKSSLTNDQHKAALPEHFLDSLVFHGLTFLGQCLQPGEQPDQVVGNPRIMLDVIVTVEILARCVQDVDSVDGQNDVAHFVDELEDGERCFGRPVCRDAEWNGDRQTGVGWRLCTERARTPGLPASRVLGHDLPPRRCLPFRSARSFASLAR